MLFFQTLCQCSNQFRSINILLQANKHLSKFSIITIVSSFVYYLLLLIIESSKMAYKSLHWLLVLLLMSLLDWSMKPIIMSWYLCNWFVPKLWCCHMVRLLPQLFFQMVNQSLLLCCCP